MGVWVRNYRVQGDQQSITIPSCLAIGCLFVLLMTSDSNGGSQRGGMADGHVHKQVFSLCF